MAFKSLGPDEPFRSWATGRAEPRLTEVPRDATDEGRPDVDRIQEMLQEAQERAEASVRAELEAELVQLRELAESVGPLIVELETLRRRQLDALSDDIASVVRTFARRVVHDALAMHPDALPTLVRDAIAQLPERDEISIAVSAQASEALTRSLPSELRDRVRVDPEIEAGAKVSTRNASVDATLATAEAGLESALQEWLAEQWWVGDGV